MSFEFDEYAYLNRYPDVRSAIERGQVRSGRTHFEEHGEREGRRPHAIVGDAPRTFVAGAYGTNNVGDEAIFEGVRETFGDNTIQLYINAPRNVTAVEMFSMLRNGNKFRQEDTLIIGGGGLLYDRSAIQTLIDLCARARDAGATIRILGVGCEGARSEYHDEIRTLFSYSDDVVVRSSMSQEIAKAITGMDVRREEDFAFRLRSKMAPRVRGERNSIDIGVVTDGSHEVSYGDLVELVRRYASDRAPVPVRFFHIPHSASYVGFTNNDTVVGTKLFTSVATFLDGRSHSFRPLPFQPEPSEVLKTYARLDGVISYRFHGLVFGRMANLPTIVMNAGALKNRAFADDYARADLLRVERPGQLWEQFQTMLQLIASRG